MSPPLGKNSGLEPLSQLFGECLLRRQLQWIFDPLRLSMKTMTRILRTFLVTKGLRSNTNSSRRETGLSWLWIPSFYCWTLDCFSWLAPPEQLSWLKTLHLFGCHTQVSPSAVVNFYTRDAQSTWANNLHLLRRLDSTCSAVTTSNLWWQVWNPWSIPRETSARIGGRLGWLREEKVHLDLIS